MHVSARSEKLLELLFDLNKGALGYGQQLINLLKQLILLFIHSDETFKRRICQDKFNLRIEQIYFVSFSLATFVLGRTDRMDCVKCSKAKILSLSQSAMWVGSPLGFLRF